MRGIEHLIKEAREKAELLVSECAKVGLIVKITDTLRAKQEQDALYNQGRTTAGNIVTNCKYPNSMHNWGVAFDICRNDGRGAYNDSDGWFSKVGAIGERIGLEWGGHFKSFVDKPHFQLKQWGSTPKKLINTYKNPDNFRATYSVDNKIDEAHVKKLQKGDRGSDVVILQALLRMDVKDIDGIFGGQTQIEVLTFQKNYGLAQDGIVGKNTWGELYEQTRFL